MPTTASPVSLRSTFRVIAVLAAVSPAGCDLNPASPDGGPLRVALGVRASFSSAVSGDDGDAYDAADGVWVRLGRQGSAPVFEDVLPFDPSTENRVTVELEIEERTTMVLEVELRRGSDALFEGSTSVTLTPGFSEEVDIELNPVAVGLEVSPPAGPLVSLGETTPLRSALLFATGDTARGLVPDWTSLDPGIADVVSAQGAPHARAVSNGVARLRASYGSFTRQTTVTVDIQVVAVDVSPESSEIDVGQTVQLTAVPRDALDNDLTGLPTAWTSSDPTVATVSGTGLVTGVGPGVAQITATVDEVEGTAEVEVVARAPEVTTSGSESTGVTTARLRGVVRPGGLATTAWFEWGTDPDLATSDRTPDLPVGSGGVDVPVSTTVSGLAPDTRYYFRAAASNSLGTARGEILSFDTPPVQRPTVVTGGVEDIGLSSATGFGTVTPNGAATQAWFEWSTDPSFVEADRSSSISIPAGAGPEEIEAIMDVFPETTFYFRAAASNSVGTAVGETLGFRTPIPAPSDLDGGLDGPTVFLGWDDNSTTDTYFRIERSETSSTSGFEVVGFVSDDGPDFDRDFFDEGSESDPLPTGILYYRVFACNADDECSDASNVHSVSNLPSIGGYLDYCSDLCDAVGFEVTLTGPVNRTAVTDSGGFFFFPDLPLGTYTVTAREDYCPDFQVDFAAESREVTLSSAEDSPFLTFNGSGLMSCGGLR